MKTGARRLIKSQVLLPAIIRFFTSQKIVYRILLWVGNRLCNTKFRGMKDKKNLRALVEIEKRYLDILKAAFLPSFPGYTMVHS